MKKAIILLLIVVPFMAQSNDMFFNRLEKLNNKDQKKCLEVAKRYMKIFPENPAAYYFSSIIYNDKADKSRSTSGKYRNLKRAIGYAITFEEKDDGAIASSVNWSDYTAELTKRSFAIADKLEAENEERYSSDLLATLNKLDKTVVITLDEETLAETKTTFIESESDVEIVEISPIAAPVKVDANSKVELFGMPNGNEIIASSNLVGEQDVLKLINAERVKKGMSKLEWDEDLANAARYHAYDLATQDYFDHASYDRTGGKLVQVGGTFTRIKTFYSKSFVNSENIAAGNASAKATYDQWFNSPGHYDNMFNSESKKVGLGVFYDENSTFGYYWVFCSAM